MRYLIVITILINLISKSTLSHPLNNIDNNIESFGILEIYAQIKLKDKIFCNPLIQSCNKNISIAILSMNSLLSKVPVLKSSSVCIESGNISTFITANHVCNEIDNANNETDSFKDSINTIMNNLKSINPDVKNSDVTIQFYYHIKNINDKKFKIVKIGKRLKDFDLCLLKIEGKYESTSKISKRIPKIGDMIYNIAIPEGIQFKDTLPIFTGIYSGTYESDDSNYSYLLSIPASQGSSGSPVFNSDGEIIGIIYAAFKNFSHLSIASTLDQVKTLTK